MYWGYFADASMKYRTILINSIEPHELGFDMLRGESTAEGIMQWVDTERPDVFITNTSLPDMSGLEVARRVRDKHPNVRVILISDEASYTETREALRFGAFDYLLKSEGIETVRESIVRALRETDAERQETQLLQSTVVGEEGLIETGRLLGALRQKAAGEAGRTNLTSKSMPSNNAVSTNDLMLRAVWQELLREIRRRDESLIGRIQDMVARATAEDPVTRAVFLKLIGQIKQLLASQDLISQEDVLQSDCIGRACAYMHAHLREKFTYQDVAAYVHVSPRHFIRKFRSEMDETFTDYLIRLRIQTAVRLLENGMEVEAIPEAVGYRDEKYFRKLFKKHVGCTLREYQNKRHLDSRN